MKEVSGNFWEHCFDYQAIVITTNTTLKADGTLVMGGGIAKDAADRYPFLPGAFGKKINGRAKDKKAWLMVEELSYDFMPYYAIAFPTKYDWRYKSDMSLIKASLKQLMYLADVMDWNSVLVPRPGCGLGGLLWDDVKPVCEEYLDDKFTIIYGG